MTQAWIGFAGGIIAVIVSALLAVRQSRMAERLARLTSDLQAERDAEKVLMRYREPLAAAAFDLQSRLYNILGLDFLEKFGGDHAQADEALRTTLFRLAQYFGWTEILRRDIQFLSFPEAADTLRVAELQHKISQRFLTSKLPPALMIWSDEQRALGERMIVEEHGQVLCMGYARFRDACDDVFAPWLDRLRSGLEQESARDRMLEVQHLLCELVETLDTNRVRYSRDLDRA